MFIPIHYSEELKADIVRKHNEARLLEPCAKDMNMLQWHDGLADLAREVVDRCEPGHSSEDFRRNKYGFKYIGENGNWDSSRSE